MIRVVRTRLAIVVALAVGVGLGSLLPGALATLLVDGALPSTPVSLPADR